MPSILVLSGPICAGKSALAREINQQNNFEIFSTSQELKKEADRLSRPQDRGSLQQLGVDLDGTTNFRWIANAIKQSYASLDFAKIVIDSVRVPEQLVALRELFGWRVLHVHLTAPKEALGERFNERNRAGEISLIADAMLFPTEKFEAELSRTADLVIDTSRCDPDDIYVRVAARLGIFAPPTERLVDVLIGGQFGSEGKGQVAAYLAREYDVVMRVGGPNAGHRVNSESGEYTYIHLPSGCRDNNAKILIGAGAVINPTLFLEEMTELGIDPQRVFVDPHATTITPTDIQAEERLKKEIGSTGQGVGFATARKITERRVDSDVVLAKHHPELKIFVRPTIDELERSYSSGQRIFLEGTQGAGLSIHHGPYPHVTSRDTNVAGCLSEAGISPTRIRRVVTVMRPYPIRVSNPDQEGKSSGNLKKEIDVDVIADRAGLDGEKLRKLEVTSRTKRPRRFGEFEWTTFRRTCAINAPTDIALTFADYIHIKNRDAFRFEQLTPETIQFIEELERVSQAPVSLINTKFDQRSVIDRRDWGVGRRLWQQQKK